MQTPTDNEHYFVLCHETDKDWLKLRHTGIGASEIASVCQASPWKSRLALYAEKAGFMDPPDLSDNQAAEWGHRHEETIAKKWMDQHPDVPIHRSGFLLRSKEHPFLLCTPDYVFEDDRPFEIKTAGLSTRALWEGRTPDTVMYQLQQQMIVLGAHEGVIAVLITGNDYREHRVKRDETLCRKIIRQGEEFWRRVREKDEPPADRSESAKIALTAIYGDPNPGEVMELNDSDFMGLGDRYDQIKLTMKELKMEQLEIENYIKQKMGNAEYGALSDGSNFSWKKQIRKEHTVHYEESTSRVFRRRKPKES